VLSFALSQTQVKYFRLMRNDMLEMDQLQVKLSSCISKLVP
jgi:hypothetical protein